MMRRSGSGESNNSDNREPNTPNSEAHQEEIGSSIASRARRKLSKNGETRRKTDETGMNTGVRRRRLRDDLRKINPEDSMDASIASHQSAQVTSTRKKESRRSRAGSSKMNDMDISSQSVDVVGSRRKSRLSSSRRKTTSSRVGMNDVSAHSMDGTDLASPRRSSRRHRSSEKQLAKSASSMHEATRDLPGSDIPSTSKRRFQRSFSSLSSSVATSIPEHSPRVPTTTTTTTTTTVRRKKKIEKNESPLLSDESPTATTTLSSNDEVDPKLQAGSLSYESPDTGSVGSFFEDQFDMSDNDNGESEVAREERRKLLRQELMVDENNTPLPFADNSEENSDSLDKGGDPPGQVYSKTSTTTEKDLPSRASSKQRRSAKLKSPRREHSRRRLSENYSKFAHSSPSLQYSPSVGAVMAATATARSGLGPKRKSSKRLLVMTDNHHNHHRTMGRRRSMDSAEASELLAAAARDNGEEVGLSRSHRIRSSETSRRRRSMNSVDGKSASDIFAAVGPVNLEDNISRSSRTASSSHSTRSRRRSKRSSTQESTTTTTGRSSTTSRDLRRSKSASSKTKRKGNADIGSLLSHLPPNMSDETRSIPSMEGSLIHTYIPNAVKDSLKQQQQQQQQQEQQSEGGSDDSENSPTNGRKGRSSVSPTEPRSSKTRVKRRTISENAGGDSTYHPRSSSLEEDHQEDPMSKAASELSSRRSSRDSSKSSTDDAEEKPTHTKHRKGRKSNMNSSDNSGKRRSRHSTKKGKLVRKRSSCGRQGVDGGGGGGDDDEATASVVPSTTTTTTATDQPLQAVALQFDPTSTNHVTEMTVTLVSMVSDSENEDDDGKSPLEQYLPSQFNPSSTTPEQTTTTITTTAKAMMTPTTSSSSQSSGSTASSSSTTTATTAANSGTLESLSSGGTTHDQTQLSPAQQSYFPSPSPVVKGVKKRTSLMSLQLWGGKKKAHEQFEDTASVISKEL